MHLRAGLIAAMPLIAASLGGCMAPPEVPAKTRYLQQRLAVVDLKQPCLMAPFSPMEAEYVDGGIFVPVRVNGVDTLGAIDTGGSDTLITPELAAAAGLKTQPGRAWLQGISGSFRPDVAFLDQAEIGSIRRYLFGSVMVYPFVGNQGRTFGANIGLNWLDHLDYDIDLAHHTIRPYKTSNCVIVDPPWRTTSTGLALTRGISDGLNRNRQDEYAIFGMTAHISIPVAFEGAVLDAMLDTGSSSTFMSHAAAIRAGATDAELSADPVETTHGVNGRARNMIRHSFADVTIGEEEIHGFSVLVAPSFNRNDDDMVLGADFLAKRHIWLSFTTNALFIDSGEARRPEPPFDHAHAIGGAQMPGFPPDAKEHAGKVEASCTVQQDGSLTGCKITKSASDPAFDRATMLWLTSAAGPVMQPRYENGHPVSETHDWSIDFLPQ